MCKLQEQELQERKLQEDAAPAYELHGPSLIRSLWRRSDISG